MLHRFDLGQTTNIMSRRTNGRMSSIRTNKYFIKMSDNDEDIILDVADFIFISEDKPQNKKKRRTWVRLSFNKKKYNSNRMLPNYIQDDLIGFGPGEEIRN